MLGSASECFGSQICAVSLLVGELVGGDFVGWPESDSVWREQESGRIWRNPEESFVQEFLSHRNSCKKSCEIGEKQEFLRPPPKPRSCKIYSGRHRKKQKSSGILFFTVFEPPK